MKRYIIIFLFSCFNISCVYSRGASDVRIAVISSLERVLRDDIDVNGTPIAEVSCAKNEYESFQIIVTNSTDKPIAQINLKADNWHFTGMPDNGVPEITLFREHYVQIEKTSPYSKGKPGWYPDALIPFINPYTGQKIANAKYLAANQDVAPNRSQGYWIDIYVPTNTKAGIYTNKITVFSEGKILAEIPVKLVIWNFELPKVHELKTYFGKLYNIDTYYSISPNSSRYRLILERYRDILYESGIDVVYHIYPQSFDKSGGVVFAQDYLQEVKDFSERYGAKLFRISVTDCSNPEKIVNAEQYLSSLNDFLKVNPWIKFPFIYIDEPGTLEAYKQIAWYGKMLNQYAPEIKLLVTEQIKPQKPDWPNLEGFIDIWVPLWGLADTNDIKRRQKAGDEVWSYTALARSDDAPTWLLDSPLLDYRIPVWFSWSLELKGILYWTTTAWASREIDPWVESVTYSKHSRNWNGEGCLLYPGIQAGIDGPIASMRLKVFRDSVEDYDYFSILNNIVGLEQTKTITKNTAKSFTQYSRNIGDYLEARKTIAQQIENASAK
jgi:hypothetical protein